MKTFAFGAVLLARACAGQSAGTPTLHGEGLHGYIGFDAVDPPNPAGYRAGISFYSAVWPLIDAPLANFQFGLASTWIIPDNADNTDTPLAPKGTLAREWPERGPTWDTVFQTVEGGIGYWAGNHFRYGFPKFSMNATPQCYDYEIGSPGWSFFQSDMALSDDRLGVAQLSNRLLIPPDGLPFAGAPNGEFLGYAWMALPFTDAVGGERPTGGQSWTCFLHAGNFRGPIAYYVPETWSKIAVLFDEPFLFGRGLDARPGVAGGGAMEINTIPRLDARARDGTIYSKIPAMRFPVDENGRAIIIQDVTYYSEAALADAFLAWRSGGPPCPARFNDTGAWRCRLTTHTTSYEQARMPLTGVELAFDTKVFDESAWGIEWFSSGLTPNGLFPRYARESNGERTAIAESDVPLETGLIDADFPHATSGNSYASPDRGAWTKPGPASEPFTARLVDGSIVTYRWYRFVDQPTFQQYGWDDKTKASLQAFVEAVHASWTIELDYMSPLRSGTLVWLDPGLLVNPPKGLEVGYVPIVTGQSGR